MLQVTSTVTGEKAPFETIEPGRVRMYVCGPNLYGPAHVGHAFSYVVFDVIRRYLEYRGYQVRHVQNFTDIEDRIIETAREQGTTLEALAEKHVQRFLEEMDALGVLPAHDYPRATRFIPQMVRLITGLVDRDYAYVVDGDVYFRVRRFPDYGQLSHRSPDEMRAGSRVEIDPRKEDPLDFALWKAAKPGEPAWDSPWGQGRPGWHIECSAMSIHYLGQQLDIHGGGLDVLFPHHENEIAQSVAFTGQEPFARYWLHNGLLRLSEGGEKMTRHLGNLIAIRQALDTFDPGALRLFFLSSHYRAPITWSPEGVRGYERALERLRNALRRHPAPVGGGDLPQEPPRQSEGAGGDAQRVPPRAAGRPGAPAPGLDGGPPLLVERAQAAREAFVAAMDDDFNTPQAIAQIFELVREINAARAAHPGANLEPAQAVLEELAGVLGLRVTLEEARPAEVGPFIQLAIEIRDELRRRREFALADRIRDRLGELGVALEDTAEGTLWKQKRE